jgi:hypothetical protein
MAREALFRLLGGGLIVCGTVFGCSNTSTLQRPPQALPERVTPNASSELAAIDVSFTSDTEEPREPLRDVEIISALADQTIISVNEDTVGDAASILHFQPARRGRDTVGVHVFFPDGQQDADDGTYLGLSRSDRIEEIDGLTIASLSPFLELWRGVGKKPEVRLLLNREGNAHTIIYRRRSAATARGD